MSVREFSSLSFDKPKMNATDKGYTAEKAQSVRNDAKVLHLTARDVFSEIEKFISEVNPGLVEALKTGGQTDDESCTIDELQRIDALLENSPDNDNHPLDPDWCDLLPQGSVAKPKDNKRFDIGMGRYHFTISRGHRVDVKRVMALSGLVRLRRKLGYAMNKQLHHSQARFAEFEEVKLHRKQVRKLIQKGVSVHFIKPKIQWMTAFHRSAIDSTLDEAVRKVVERDSLITPEEDFATEIVESFMQVSININPAELEVMANILLSYDLGAWEEEDNSCEKVVIGAEWYDMLPHNVLHRVRQKTLLKSASRPSTRDVRDQFLDDAWQSEEEDNEG